MGIVLPRITVAMLRDDVEKINVLYREDGTITGFVKSATYSDQLWKIRPLRLLSIKELEYKYADKICSLVQRDTFGKVGWCDQMGRIMAGREQIVKVNLLFDRPHKIMLNSIWFHKYMFEILDETTVDSAESNLGSPNPEITVLDRSLISIPTIQLNTNN